MFMKSILTAAVLAAGVAWPSAADISGAGATFPFPIYAKWADAYKKDTGNGLNYQSIGSGGGIKQIRAKTVTFGATDKPLKAEELDKAACAVADGDGRHRGGGQPRRRQARATSSSTARRSPTSILGKITTWNDPAHQGAQSEARAAEPADHRRPSLGRLGHHLQVHRLPRRRCRRSGRPRSASSDAVEWPGGIGAKGNDGVANNVATTGRDRLRRIRLRQAEQADLRPDGQQGRQGGRARRWRRSRPPRPTPIGTMRPASIWSSPTSRATSRGR